MADDPTEMFDQYIEALVARDEERSKQIQDQLAANFEAQRKSVADLLDQHLNAHKKALGDAEKWLYRTLRQPPQP